MFYNEIRTCATPLNMLQCLQIDVFCINTGRGERMRGNQNKLVFCFMSFFLIFACLSLSFSRIHLNTGNIKRNSDARGYMVSKQNGDYNACMPTTSEYPSNNRTQYKPRKTRGFLKLRKLYTGALCQHPSQRLIAMDCITVQLAALSLVQYFVRHVTVPHSVHAPPLLNTFMN